MTIYKDTIVAEQPIYGSSRLGHFNGTRTEGYQTLGARKYELSNHLGNVLSIITDNADIGTDSTWAKATSTSDYYPFGLEMQGRVWSDTTSTYRYGFNGKEKDDSGEFGNTHYDYGFRIYNPAIAKFLSVDPLTKSYPWYTPYQFSGNTPIQAIDLDGLEPLFVITGVTVAKSQTGQTGHSRGQYFLYRVEIYENMTPDEYKNAYNSGLLRKPDATTVIGRDAWNDEPRTNVRYSTNNEAPPGEGYINYWPTGSPGSFKLYFGIEIKGSTNTTEGLNPAYKNDRVIIGPNGPRGGVAIHKWSPHDSGMQYNRK